MHYGTWDKLHIFEEFLDFPALADMDICADVLGFSAQFCSDFLHHSVWKNLGRNSVRIHVENGKSQSRTYVQSLVKLSQLC